MSVHAFTGAKDLEEFDDPDSELRILSGTLVKGIGESYVQKVIPGGWCT